MFPNEKYDLLIETNPIQYKNECLGNNEGPP